MLIIIYIFLHYITIYLAELILKYVNNNMYKYKSIKINK